MLIQPSVWACCQYGRCMLMVVKSVVCHSKRLILTMIEEKLSFGNSLPSFFSEWIVQENNFTQCCPRLGDIILSSFLDAEHPLALSNPLSWPPSVLKCFSACTGIPVLILSLMQHTGGTYSPVPDTHVWHSVPSLELTVYDFPQQHNSAQWLNTFRFLSVLH